MFLLYIPMLILANASSNYTEVYLPARMRGGVSALLSAILTGEPWNVPGPAPHSTAVMKASSS